MLDWLSTGLSTVYTVLIVWALVSAGMAHHATLRGLSRAVTLCLIAAVLALASGVVALLDDDGWWWLMIGLAVVKLVCALGMAHYNVLRRDLKGEQVQAEADRVVRDYLSRGL